MSENSASAILHEQKLKLICDLFNSSANFGIDGVMDCTKRDPYRQSFCSCKIAFAEFSLISACIYQVEEIHDRAVPSK